jgi:hypothetical protein
VARSAGIRQLRDESQSPEDGVSDRGAPSGQPRATRPRVASTRNYGNRARELRRAETCADGQGSRSPGVDHWSHGGAEAAAQQHVDRSTTIRIRTVAKEGALALAASKPGVQAREHDYELEAAKAEGGWG